jgi:hypothetical protein
MSKDKYLYFKDQFNILETELKDTLDKTHSFFKKYEEIHPADSTLKIKTILTKISELKQTDNNIRNEIYNQQLDGIEEVNNSTNANNIIENEQYSEILKDKIYMFNHHTSYGIILLAGICSMAYLSQPKIVG